LLTVDGGPALALYRFLIAELLRAEIRAGRGRHPTLTELPRADSS
jgi:hypothetical protein